MRRMPRTCPSIRFNRVTIACCCASSNMDPSCVSGRGWTHYTISGPTRPASGRRPCRPGGDLTAPRPMNDYSFSGQADRDPASRDRRLREARVLQRAGRRRGARGGRGGGHRLPVFPQQGRRARVDLRAHHARGHRGRPRMRRAAAGSRRAAPRARARPPRASTVHEIHGTLLGDAPSRVPGHHPRHHRRGPADRCVPGGREPDARRKAAVRRPGRDGDELGPQPPEVLAGRRGRSHHRLFRERACGSPSCPLRGGCRGTRPAEGPVVTIRSAAVLGAGVMGAQIAAHLANAGVRVRLLDVTNDAAREGLERARKLKPDPFFTPAAVCLIETGGFDEDLRRAADADWIIEAIVERLDAKQALMARVDGIRRADAVVSSNTSGIPISSIAEGRSDAFRRHWVGTHFFNPPRYLHLLELIPTADTDPEVTRRVGEFCDVRLGKGVVRAKDRPGFIANRIGIHGVVQALRAIESDGYTIEEVDAMTGPAIGRPKSATFRTVDIAGVDVLAHVARMLSERLDDADERAAFRLPAFVDEMVARGMTGAKAGRGFYEKRGDEILTLDPKTLEYRPRLAPTPPSLDAAKAIESTAERIGSLHRGKDRVGTFLRAVLHPTLDYAVRIPGDARYLARTHTRPRPPGHSVAPSVSLDAPRHQAQRGGEPDRFGRRRPADRIPLQ